VKQIQYIEVDRPSQTRDWLEDGHECSFEQAAAERKMRCCCCVCKRSISHFTMTAESQRPSGTITIAGLPITSPLSPVDGLHTTFSHSVLEVGADSTEGQSLILKGTIFTKLVTTKRMIIRMIVLDLDTKLIGKLLQGMLAEESFTHTLGDLVSYEGETSGMINVESPTIILDVLAFLSTCMG
jgi:hypothetical protein